MERRPPSSHAVCTLPSTPVNGSWLFLGHPEQEGLQDASKDFLPVRWALSFPETTGLVHVPCAQLLPQPWNDSGSSGRQVCPHPGGPGSSPTNTQNGCNGTPSGGVSLPRSAGAGGHPRLLKVLCPLGPRPPCFPASPLLIPAALPAPPQLSELKCGRPGAQRPPLLCAHSPGAVSSSRGCQHTHSCVSRPRVLRPPVSSSCGRTCTFLRWESSVDSSVSHVFPLKTRFCSSSRLRKGETVLSSSWPQSWGAIKSSFYVPPRRSLSKSAILVLEVQTPPGPNAGSSP